MWSKHDYNIKNEFNYLGWLYCLLNKLGFSLDLIFECNLLLVLVWKKDYLLILCISRMYD